MYVGVYASGAVSSSSSELALLSLPEKLSPSQDEVAGHHVSCTYSCHTCTLIADLIAGALHVTGRRGCSPLSNVDN